MLITTAPPDSSSPLPRSTDTTALNDPSLRHDPKPLATELGFHLLPGAKHILLAMPELTHAGFRLWLTDYGDSLLLLPPPSHLAVVLNRQHSTNISTRGLGLWHIDFEANSNSLRVLNRTVPTPFFLHSEPTSISSTTTISSDLPTTPTALSLAHIPNPILDEHTWHGRNCADSVSSTLLYRHYLANIPYQHATLLIAEASIPPTESNPRRGRRNRYKSLNGLSLHAALGHPTLKRLNAWRRLTDGFPTKFHAFPNHRCYGCRAGNSQHQPVPNGYTTAAPPPTFRPRAAKGQVWYVDFSRTFAAPDIYGNTCFILFVEQRTLYVKIYLLRDHTDFWHHANSLAQWVKATLGLGISDIFADSDPTWTNNSSSLETKTSLCRKFEAENLLRFHFSPPHTHAMNLAEGRMRPINALTCMQLQYAYLADPLWGPSALHAATIHNFGPILDSGRPDLTDTVPFTALLGRRVDIRSLAGAFGSTAWVKVPSSKSSDLSRQARLGIFLGLAPDTIGWRILLLEDRTETVSYHIVLEHDMSARPALLAQHDRLPLLRSHLSAGPTLFNRAIRDLFSSTLPSTESRSLIVFSKLTHQPITLRLASTPGPDPDTFLTENMVDPPTPPSNSRNYRTSPRSPRRPQTARHQSETSTPTDASLAPGTAAPTVPLNTNGRQRLRMIFNLRPDTPLRCALDNPKKPTSKSAARFAATMHSKSIAEYRANGGKFSDFANDYNRNFLELGTLASLRCLDPTLCLLFLHPPNLSSLLTANLPTRRYPPLPSMVSPPNHNDDFFTYTNFPAYESDDHPPPPTTALCALLAPDTTAASQYPPPETTRNSPPSSNTSNPSENAPTSIRKTVDAILHEISDATSLPAHFNLDALAQSVSVRIAPQLDFFDHHYPGPDDFLDCVFNAVANEPYTIKKRHDDPTTYKRLLLHPNLESFRKALLDEPLQHFDVFHAFTRIRLAEARAAKATYTVAYSAAASFLTALPLHLFQRCRFIIYSAAASFLTALPLRSPQRCRFVHFSAAASFISALPLRSFQRCCIVHFSAAASFLTALPLRYSQCCRFVHHSAAASFLTALPLRISQRCRFVIHSAAASFLTALPHRSLQR